MRPVTLLLAAVLAGVYALELAQGVETVGYAHGFVAAYPSLETAISSLFLHSSLPHLLGNLAFLVVFGAIVEGALGSLRFSALFAAAGLGGCAVHYLVDSSSTTPLVGASGPLCGLIAFSVAVDKRFAGFAVAFAAVSVWQAMTGSNGDISVGAHVGGLFVGAAAALFFMRVCGSEALETA